MGYGRIAPTSPCAYSHRVTPAKKIYKVSEVIALTGLQAYQQGNRTVLDASERNGL